jgi:hypothetical protein
MRPADEDVPAISLPERQNSCRCTNEYPHRQKKNTDRLDDLLIYWWIPDDAGGIIFFHFFLKLSIVNYTITPPRLRRYPSYLKRGAGSHLPYNRPLKIRGQALPPGSAGVMIFLHFQLLHFFLNSQLFIIHYPLILGALPQTPHSFLPWCKKECKKNQDCISSSTR